MSGGNVRDWYAMKHTPTRGPYVRTEVGALVRELLSGCRWTGALSHFLGGLRKHVARRLTAERRGGGGGDEDDESEECGEGGEQAEPEDAIGIADAGVPVLKLQVECVLTTMLGPVAVIFSQEMH